MTARMRRLYWDGADGRRAGRGARAAGSVRCGECRATFIAWLNAPDEGGPRRGLALSARDLPAIGPTCRCAFPDIDGVDAARFARLGSGRQWRRGATDPPASCCRHVSRR